MVGQIKSVFICEWGEFNTKHLPEVLIDAYNEGIEQTEKRVCCGTCGHESTVVELKLTPRARVAQKLLERICSGLWHGYDITWEREWDLHGKSS